MKCFLRALIFSCCLLAPLARADGPDDAYVTIYTLIQQGDALSERGKTIPALAKYNEAQNALRRFPVNYPGWNEKVVSYRLKYLAAKINQLQSNLPPPPAPEKALANIPAATFSPSNAPAPAVTLATNASDIPMAPSTISENRINNLETQIRQLESDKGVLEAKLKEALAAQPGPVNPEEFAKAREQIKQLEKENELLKTTLAQARGGSGAIFPANPDAVQQELSDFKRRVIQLTQDNAALAAEKSALETKLKASGAPDETTAALRQENALLKKQLGELKEKLAAASPAEELNRKYQAAQTQLAALQSDKELLQQEKLVLQNKVKELSAAPAQNSNAVVVVSPVETAQPKIATNIWTLPAANAPIVLPAAANGNGAPTNQLSQLELQRDELQKNLAAATKDIYGRKKGKEMAARIQEMTRQLVELRARIQVLESPAIPYSAEELTLLGRPSTTLVASAHVSAKKKFNEISPGEQVMLSDARRFFIAHELDKAEAKYLEVLKMDGQNPTLLADLASIQGDMGKMGEAEKNLNAALALDPEDDYGLYTMGKLKFQEKKYEDAFEFLSRAAQINPQNATLQNLLGLSLSQKGLRGPAETAFRKAIQIDPGFSDAHINLAVVYVTQQPPLTELARWHYQKALAAGHEPSPKLEKMLEQSAAGATTPDH